MFIRYSYCLRVTNIMTVCGRARKNRLHLSVKVTAISLPPSQYIFHVPSGILYELLVQTVLDTKMKQAEKRDAIRLRGMDFNRRGSYDRPPAVLERYPDDMLRGLSTWSYFNVAYRVWKRDREG